MKRFAIAAAFCFTVLTATARADTWVVFASDAGRVPTGNASLLPIWQGAGTAYGIPWQVLAAINRVETDNGRNLSASSAGAIGWMQFMPGTWLRWGTDANGDGIADPWNPEDAIYSAARYLAASGGQTDLRRAIYSYNHASWYVTKVLRLAARFGNPVKPVGPSTVEVGELKSAVAQARVQADAANSALAAARATAGRAAGDHQKLVVRSTKLPLFTARLAYQRLAALAAGNEVGARAQLASAERKAATARARLERTRTRLAEAAKARRIAAAAAKQARRRQRAARRTAATSWAQQVPWLDGFTGPGATASAPGRAPRLGGPPLRILSKPGPVIRFTLNS